MVLFSLLQAFKLSEFYLTNNFLQTLLSRLALIGSETYKGMSVLFVEMPYLLFYIHCFVFIAFINRYNLTIRFESANTTHLIRLAPF